MGEVKIIARGGKKLKSRQKEEARGKFRNVTVHVHKAHIHKAHKEEKRSDISCESRNERERWWGEGRRNEGKLAKILLFGVTSHQKE